MRYMWKLLGIGLSAIGITLLAGGCSDYEELKNIAIDDFYPEVVAPVLRDTLSLEDMLERVDEDTKIRYEPDGLAYVEYVRERTLPAVGLTQIKDPSGELVLGSIDLTTPVVERIEYMDFQFIKGAALKEVSYEGTIGYTRISATLADGELDPDSKVEFNINFAGGRRDLAIKLDGKPEETQWEYFKDGENLKLDEVNPGVVFNKLQFKFSNMRVTGAKKGGKVNIKIVFGLKDVKLTKAIGGLLNGAGEVSSTVNFEHPVDIFKTTVFAQQKFDDVSFTMHMDKSKDTRVVFDPLKVSATYVDGQKQNSPEKKMPLENKAVSQDSMLRVSGAEPNEVPTGVTKTKLHLNGTNSNLVEVFEKAPRQLAIAPFKFTTTGYTGYENDVLAWMAVDPVKIRVVLKIPFHGFVVTNKMITDMTVSSNSFPSLDEYLRPNTGPVKTDRPIELTFTFKNHMPFDLYAGLQFLDDNGHVLFEPVFTNKDNPERKDGLSLFLRSGACDAADGSVSAEVTTSIVTRVSAKEYELLSNQAKKLRMTYRFSTPDADKGKTIRAKQRDYLFVRVAADVQGRVHIGK